MDNKGGGFPWTSLAVLVAFITSTQLVPHAFDQLRPAEKERAQAVTAADLEVEARLWEDPFVAVRRHEAERLERCDKLYKDAAKATECKLTGTSSSRSPAGLWKRLDADGDGKLDETLILVAMVPGNAFVGAEEGRRRTRYAVLSGLQAMGYVPDNPERLGVLHYEVARLRSAAQDGELMGEPDAANRLHGADALAAQAQAAASASRPKTPTASPEEKPGLLVPFEMLSRSQLPDVGLPASAASSVRAAEAPTRLPLAHRYAQVAVLWVDEAALPPFKMNALAQLLTLTMEPYGKTEAQRPKLGFIGPSSTDGLRTALADVNRYVKLHADRKSPPQDSAQPQDCDKAGASSQPVLAAASAEMPKGADRIQKGYWYLSQAAMRSPFSTAPDSMLSELGGKELGCFVSRGFTAVLKQTVKVDFQRSIGTDDQLLQQLVAEIGRRLSAGKPQRVVLLAERDSLYSQALVNQLQQLLAKQSDEAGASKPRLDLKVELQYFFRGLDGVTTRDNGRDAAGANGAGARNDASAARLEWPESRDQLDYLRRLAQSLKESEGKVDALPIGAIGLLANDVHDKLLVLQALHESFSDKVFFTTDMDARYLHPRTQSFTRNLLVSSSLPLQFAASASKECSDLARTLGLPAHNLAAGNPPWRDVYQASTYLATRDLACRSLDCRRLEQCEAEKALSAPSLYEIGRNSAVALEGYAQVRRPPVKPYAVRLVTVAVPVILILGLLVWPSTPVLRAIKRRRAAQAAAPSPAMAAELRISLPELGFVVLYAWLFFFTMVSVCELVWPGRLQFVPGMLGLSVGSTVLLLLSLTPEHRFGRASLAAPMAAGPRRALRALCWLAMLLLWIWAYAMHKPPARPEFEPLAWLEGVSAWPSHLIHLLALLAIVDTLDATWSRSVLGMAEESAWLHLPTPAPKRPGVVAREGGLRFTRRIWSRHLSVAGWHAPRGQSVDFRILWHQYGRRGGRLPRALRILLGFGLTLAVVMGLFFGFSDGIGPAVPVRGSDHRHLIRFTLDAILVMLPLLVVAVGDATMLACRFIQLLTASRTVYPAPTLAYFAASLGGMHEALWLRPIAADPAQRADAPPELRRHSLLDDWIDVQIVVRRSARIGPLVMGPFVVLALLIVGRSRLFDNWSLTLPVAMAACAYLLGLLALAVLLKQAAEQARSRALRRMEADLRWLMGGDEEQRKLIEPFKRLMASVQDERGGALAPIFEQPMVKALLVPLGGAGGAQLFEYFLLAR